MMIPTLAALASLVLIAVPKWGLAAQEEFVVGAWYGSAYYNDDGYFTHCGIASQYLSNITLIFIWSTKGLSVGLGHSNWHLEDDVEYPITINIDRGWRRNVLGIAIDNLIRIDLGDDHDMVEAFKHGNVFAVNAAQSTFEFNLTGTATALPRLRNCFINHAYRQEVNPFSANEHENSFLQCDMEDSRSIGLSFESFEALIKTALGPSTVAFPKRNEGEMIYVFKTKQVDGIYLKSNINEQSIDGLSSEIAGFIQSMCYGSFASIVKKKDIRNLVNLRQMSMACGSGEVAYFGVSVAEHGELRYVFFVSGTANQQNDVEEANNRIYGSLLNIANKRKYLLIYQRIR